MPVLRRAVLFSALERYLALGLSFLNIFVISRLLTPAELGLSMIGVGVFALTLSLREFASAEILIQRRDVDRSDIRTTLTLTLGIYVVFAGAMTALGGVIADFYGRPELAGYLRLIALAGLIETLSLPLLALLRRDMAFGGVALISTGAVAASTAATIGAALLGFGFMSIAFGYLASGLVTTILALTLRPNWWMFCPSLAQWREVASFGVYQGSTIVLSRIHEMLPQLFLGRVLTAEAVAFFNRANLMTDLPERTVLPGIYSVTLPAFAREVREGRPINRLYLDALAMITVMYWPALIGLVILADPLVRLLLGEQWTAIAPLVRIIATACLLWFPVFLMQPVLVAVGDLRGNLRAKALCVGVCGTVLCVASFYGIYAMAWSQFFGIPFQMLVAFLAVRRHVAFAWSDILEAVRRSAVVAVLAATGPVAVAILNSRGLDMSLPSAALAMLLAAIGWGIGVRLTRHRILSEALAVFARLPIAPAFALWPGLNRYLAGRMALRGAASATKLNPGRRRRWLL